MVVGGEMRSLISRSRGPIMRWVLRVGMGGGSLVGVWLGLCSVLSSVVSISVAASFQCMLGTWLVFVVVVSIMQATRLTFFDSLCFVSYFLTWRRRLLFV
jgi:hypothetical protein